MLKSGLRHARKGLDFICHLKEMLSLLDGSNCLDQEQLHGQQDAANISRDLVGSGVMPSDFSLKADPLTLKKFVCKVPYSLSGRP